MTRFFCLINGILTPTSDQHHWTNAAEAWIERNGCGYADSYRYLCGAIGRRLGHARRVADVHAMCAARAKAGQAVHLVAHSNGAQVAADVVARHPGLAVEGLHLIAAACPADFDANGLNAAVASGRVRDVTCYCSRSDDALKLAGASRHLFGWLGLGYGDLGRVGPQRVARDAWPFVLTYWEDFGHSEWFAPANFDALMRIVTAKAGS